MLVIVSRKVRYRVSKDPVNPRVGVSCILILRRPAGARYGSDRSDGICGAASLLVRYLTLCCSAKVFGVAPQAAGSAGGLSRRLRGHLEREWRPSAFTRSRAAPDGGDLRDGSDDRRDFPEQGVRY